ncbi:MAG TPA: fused MFS/spermidine synthase [Solirubrobacteraceae bacterium]|jgi:spermidine synthase|nr:fused MFS/spermidine synthase [Solirubrobacteraceae bacterium]
MRPPLGLVVFVVGAASLGAEIAAARLLAPYYGASTIIWANTIATVLVALSAGYALGGRLADRAPFMQRLCQIVAAAAVLLGAVPFLSGPLLRVASTAIGSLSVGAFFGSLLAVLALVAVPVLLLGTVAPFAIRLSLERTEDAGRVSGRLYALSTAGSLVGTFLAALLLIPFAGTHRTFLAFALALALVAVAGLPRRYLAVPLVLAVLLVLPPGGTDLSIAGGGRVIYEAETQYQYARVVEQPGGERWLQLNEGVATHSLYVPGSYLTGNYWDEFLVLPFAVRPGPPERIAILGDAAGTTARAYGHYFPRTTIDAVELDGQLTEIGRRFFALGQRPRLHTITADARPWLASVSAHYDAIFLDAYRQPYIPFYLATREFFALLRSHLRPGGLVAVNVGHPSGSTALERATAATLRAVFPFVARDPAQPTNTLLLASSSPMTPSTLSAAAPSLPAQLRPIAAASAGRLGDALRGGPVYSDDRAPVEWLVDESIIGYLARGR